MNILVVASSYPHSGYRFSGIFNERSVRAIKGLCDHVEALVPRPYVPSLLSSIVPRWQTYAAASEHESKNGIPVFRPATLVVPRVAQAFWSNQAAFLTCRRTARTMHERVGFDAIMSFDLAAAGGLAWRLGRHLRLPTTGWATGGDVRVPAFSGHGRAVIQTLQNIDLIFYQSTELLEKAAALLGKSPEELPADRHTVLPRGIPEPPNAPTAVAVSRIRATWGVSPGEIVVLYIGRILRTKGNRELLQAVALAASENARIRCVIIGSKPAFDETSFIEAQLRENPHLSERVVLLPECEPDGIWENLYAADIFAFPSHKEGMPNSLLEAMATGLPSVAFAIPPVRELDGGTGAVLLVPPLDAAAFAKALVRLVGSPDERKRIGQKAKAVISSRFMVRANMAKALAGVTELVESRTGVRHQPRFSVASQSSAR